MSIGATHEWTERVQMPLTWIIGASNLESKNSDWQSSTSLHVFSGRCRRRFSWQEPRIFKNMNSVQEVRAMSSIDEEAISSALLDSRIYYSMRVLLPAKSGHRYDEGRWFDEGSGLSGGGSENITRRFVWYSGITFQKTQNWQSRVSYNDFRWKKVCFVLLLSCGLSFRYLQVRDGEG